jgi:hypothetical protein
MHSTISIVAASSLDGTGAVIKVLWHGIVKYRAAESLRMSVECRIEVELPDEERAVEVARSISLDNGEYVTAVVTGRTIVMTAVASSTASMLHTVEDLLACLKVAESVIAPEPEQEDLTDDA